MSLALISIYKSFELSIFDDLTKLTQCISRSACKTSQSHENGQNIALADVLFPDLYYHFFRSFRFGHFGSFGHFGRCVCLFILVPLVILVVQVIMVN